jgi:hypothetical protein
MKEPRYAVFPLITDQVPVHTSLGPGRILSPSDSPRKIELSPPFLSLTSPPLPLALVRSH